ncbi:MAG: cytochrome [Massilia sp.]|nr:cytochrome [Massilia sp.]
MLANRSRLIIKTALATLALAALAGAIIGLVVLKSGIYPIGATTQHLQLVHSVLEEGMRASVQQHSRNVKVPALDSPAQLRRGAALFRDNCAHCHGGPGFAQSDWGKSMQPLPGPLVDATRRWETADIYWITKNGIKMSGMPAWQYHLTDEELWSVVSFVRQLPALTARDYQRLTEEVATPAATATAAATSTPAVLSQGDPARGKVALTQYACNACHRIAGVTGSEVFVGKPLAGLQKQQFIVGKLPMSQDNLVRWIVDPKAVDAHTAMPVMNVPEADARDMAAYLWKQR